MLATLFYHPSPAGVAARYAADLWLPCLVLTLSWLVIVVGLRLLWRPARLSRWF